MKNKELIKEGHERAAELKGSFEAINACSVAQLISDLATQLEVQFARSNALAAENAGLISSSECLLHEASEVYRAYNKTQLPDGDLVDEQCLQEVYDAINATPTTEAFLAEVRASVIPEGYVLVPQQIFLEPSDIESICSQCGDGHESGYGDFTDGLLWVGNIQCDDGSIVHGLHISSADYTEEGGVTVCEFAAQLRKGVQS